MTSELQQIISLLTDTYAGDPWFGRPVQQLLSEVDEKTAYEKPNGQHSIVELIWHMITWREFTIDRLQSSPRPMDYFEKNDWRKLNHSDKKLWQQGLDRLNDTQEELLSILKEKDDTILDHTVSERKYNFRKLLHGIIHHDIYHAGQIAYIRKMHNR